jgi:transposase
VTVASQCQIFLFLFYGSIQAWLTKHNIPFDKKLLRPELLALAKTNKPETQYIIDDIAKEKGHIILQLLPYHPDLNPIELVWAQLKKIVSSRNFNNKLNDVLEITKAFRFTRMV